MNKKMLITSLILVMLIALTGCFRFGDSSDGKKFKEEYEDLNGKLNDDGTRSYMSITIPEENPIKYSSYEEINKVLNEGTGVILFGFPECPWCRNAIPELLAIAEDLELKTIYYLNNREDRDTRVLDEEGNIVVEKEGTSEYYKLLEKLSGVASEYTGLNDATIKRIYFPTVVFVLNGEIIGYHEATLDSQEDPYIPLTKEQKEELQLIYRDYIVKVLNIACDEGC